MSRLRTWDLRTQFRDSSLRNYRFAFSLLNNLKNKLAIPDSMVERTAYTTGKLNIKVSCGTDPSLLSLLLASI